MPTLIQRANDRADTSHLFGLCDLEHIPATVDDDLDCLSADGWRGWRAGCVIVGPASQCAQHIAVLLGHGRAEIAPAILEIMRPIPREERRQEVSLVRARLQTLAKLEDGWYGPGSRAIPERLVESFEHLLLDLTERGIATPGIFPTPSGGLTAEWLTETRSICLEIERDTNPVLVSVVSLTSEDSWDEEFSLDRIEDMVAFLTPHF